MAVTHLPVKFGADIFIQSGVIDIFPKFKVAAAAILDFQIMWNKQGKQGKHAFH